MLTGIYINKLHNDYITMYNYYTCIYGITGYVY